MSNKTRITLSVIGVVISKILAEEAVISPVLATVLIIISVILVFAAISFGAKVDYETGVYECRKCGNVFKPTYKAYFLGAHTLITRHLKCPKCEENPGAKEK